MTHTRSKKRPVAVGTGLVALDEIRLAGVPKTVRSAGGTCANVLANLAALGWDTVPIARLGDDRAGRFVRSDLSAAGVDTRFLSIPPAKPTPIIVQLNELSDAGAATHRFIWKCPSCGGHLPRYAPVTLSAIDSILQADLSPDIFFFDRPSPAAVRLAREYSESGTVIVFEPSAGGNSPHFASALATADIIKYSVDRFPKLSLPPARQRRLLIEIQTLGSKGVRFRSWIPGCTRVWTRLPAFDTVRVVDTAGCGDWTTAGVLAELGRTDRERLLELNDVKLTGALRRGQALAAWSSGFAGARGGNVAQTGDQRRIAVDYILREGRQPQINRLQLPAPSSASAPVCAKCPPSLRA